MSKHWDPWGDSAGGRRTRGGTGLGAAEIGLTVAGGVIAGLLVVTVGSFFATSPEEIDFAGIEVPYRWEESRRSEELLKQQEGSPWGRSAAAPLGGTAYAEAAVRVIDGDTFDLGNQRIRIADIDTPEVNGRCPAETALAARATARISELLNQGPFELGAIGRDEDRYGRKLRIVIRDGRSLGDQLVAEGLARTWTGRREPWC
jgi:hypothetical protein